MKITQTLYKRMALFDVGRQTVMNESITVFPNIEI